MSDRVIQGRAGGLIALGAADALWVGLTNGSAVPAASAAFTAPPADARSGYILLGGRAVATVRAGGGLWSVPETEVRRAAAELNAVEVDRRDLVRIGPFRGAAERERMEGPPLRWRPRVTRELRESGTLERAARHAGGRPHHLAGIDWRPLLEARTRDHAERTWWLPRAVVRLLDAAEHAEARWLRAAPARRDAAAPAEPPSRHRQTSAADGRPPASPRQPAAPPRAYDGELQGQVYSVLGRKPGISRKVAGWRCAVCRTAPAAVLDHCHEHGYVRAPVCHSCNTQERPDHLYGNDIRVADHYIPLFHTHAADWLRHWHRCPGCRTRTTLPLPHLAAWTARISCRALRPTHREPRGSRARKPCGVLRVSWTGSQNAPRSCLLTVAVDFCPSGEHRVLARVPYREAVERFGAWLAETAPAVAAAAGPDSLEGLPTRFRPVIADTGGEGLALF
ncbi:endonuclease domain-containing protein [Streptomyces spongiicola]|uniref:endonuclease domain-containing protein n=1 Tax=Streptomyces spongiicola TaxID=1690221 RepID=UPI0033D23A61